jgi:hypothetical protein
MNLKSASMALESDPSNEFSVSSATDHVPTGIRIHRHQFSRYEVIDPTRGVERVSILAMNLRSGIPQRHVPDSISPEATRLSAVFSDDTYT